MARLFRFAPTPSGYLHSGNAISFIITWALARVTESRILLRVDDLDRLRFRTEYLENIFHTIEWLGLDYDEGPTTVADFEHIWSQHLRLDDYFLLIESLKEKGKLYGCSCSRSNRRDDISCPCFQEPKPFQPGKTSLRLHVPTQSYVNFYDKGIHQQKSVDQLMGDFVVCQKNGIPSYQIASISDDINYGVNYIVRGEDLLPSTVAQLYVSEQLSLHQFLQTKFYHHPLIRNADGLKLSKSSGALSILAWHKSSRNLEDLFEKASAMLGLKEIARKPDELLQILKANCVGVGMI